MEQALLNKTRRGGIRYTQLTQNQPAKAMRVRFPGGLLEFNKEKEMDRDTKQMLIFCVSVLIFLLIVAGSATLSNYMGNQLTTVCLQEGNPPEECGL